ncbi:hypothetical protein GW17_00006760, partial [Ensete ventricosum]
MVVSGKGSRLRWVVAVAGSEAGRRDVEGRDCWVHAWHECSGQDCPSPSPPYV